MTGSDFLERTLTLDGTTNLFETLNHDLTFNVWAVDIMSDIRHTLLTYPKAWKYEAEELGDGRKARIKSYSAIEKCFEQAFQEALYNLEDNMFYQFLSDCANYYDIELDKESAEQFNWWTLTRRSEPGYVEGAED